MASRPQLEKVAQLIAEGYQLLPPPQHQSMMCGGPTRLKAQDGKVVEVLGDGMVVEVHKVYEIRHERPERSEPDN